MGLGFGFCCCGCQIAADTFERAEIGEGWAVQDGDWSIYTQTMPTRRYLKCDAAGTIYSTTDVGALEFDARFWVHFLNAGYNPTGDKWRLLFYLDQETDEFLAVEFEVYAASVNWAGIWSFTFRSRLYGVDGEQVGHTQEWTYQVTEMWSDALFCRICVWEENDEYAVTVGIVHTSDLMFTAIPHTLGHLALDSDHAQGWGLLADPAAGQWLAFDNLLLQKTGGDCPTCSKRCSNAAWDMMPQYLSIAFSGAANKSPVDCHYCSCLNGKAWQMQLGIDQYNPCRWILTAADLVCLSPGLNGLVAWIELRESDGHYLLVIRGGGSTIWGYWTYDFGATKPEAVDWDGLELTFDGDYDPAHTVTGGPCDMTASTITVTASETDDPDPDDCIPCNCGTQMPDGIQVTISGMGARNCDCSSLDGTYVLSFVERGSYDGTDSDGGWCTYAYTLPSTVCNCTGIRVKISASHGGDVLVELTLLGLAQRSVTFSYPLNCATLDTTMTNIYAINSYVCAGPNSITYQGSFRIQAA